MNDNNEHCIARIIGPAGKSTGKYKTCKNIEYEAPGALPETKTWIDISTLENLSANQPIPPNKQSDLNIENNLLPTEEIYQTKYPFYISKRKRTMKLDQK